MALERFRDVSPLEPFAHGIKPNFILPLSPRVICLHSRIKAFLFWREGGADVPAALHKLQLSKFQASSHEVQHCRWVSGPHCITPWGLVPGELGLWCSVSANQSVL